MFPWASLSVLILESLELRVLYFARPLVALSACVEVLSESRNPPMPVSLGILPSCCCRLFRWFAKLFVSADCFVLLVIVNIIFFLVIHSRSRSALFRLNTLS